MLVRLRELPFFPSKHKATHTTWKINDWLGDCCLLGSLKWGQCLFTLRRGRWFNGWHSASGCSSRTVRQPHPGWPRLHSPLVPCLGFYVLKRFTKQMDIFMAERLSGPLCAMMSVGLPNSPLQIVGWYIIWRKYPYGFPCPALHTHCWPLPEKRYGLSRALVWPYMWKVRTLFSYLLALGECLPPGSSGAGVFPSHAPILLSALYLLQHLYHHSYALSCCLPQSRSSQECWLSTTCLVHKPSQGPSHSQHCVTSFLSSRDVYFTDLHNAQNYSLELQNIWADTTTSFYQGCRKKGCNLL